MSHPSSARDEGRWFAAIFERAGVAIGVADSTGNLVRANAAMANLVGYSVEELLRLNIADFTHPDDLPAERRFIEEMIAGRRTTFAMEKRYIRKDGGMRWVRANVSLVPDAEGRDVLGLATIEDISDRRRAEEALRLSETKFRRLVDANVIGVIVADADTITEANDIFLSMLGYTRGDLAARRISWSAMTPPEFAAIDRAKVQELLDHGVCTPFEKEYFHRDGHRVPILLGAAMLGLDPFRAVCFVLDLTQQRKAEKELRDLNESLESRVAERSAAVCELLRELEHRVKNNLSGLIALVDEMRHRTSSVAGFADAIESRLRTMARVHDLLARGQWQRLDLRSLVASVLNAAIDPARPTLVEVAGPEVAISPERAMPLALALVEWLTNSAKYGAHSVPGGRVSVSWMRPSPAARVTLRWKERGGPPITRNVVPSLGLSLVQGFATRELAGQCKLTFPEQGADHTLEFAPE